MTRFVFVVMAFIAAPFSARAEQQKWAAAYVDWTFQSEAPAIGLSQDLWIAQPATASFFTLNWDFVAGDGGYIGLQSDETGAGHARFSLWNATAAQGDACRTFDGEGEGMTCVVPVVIAPEKIYRVHVTRGEADAQGQWWIGWLETRGGARKRIGALRVNAALTSVTPAGMHNFSEYWGNAVAACRAVPLSAAAFGPPALMRTGSAAAIGAQPAGRRPDGHRCRTGRERSGAVVGHTPVPVAQAPGMLITLGGDANANRTLAQRLSRPAPQP
jgi:hypothetical protein